MTEARIESPPPRSRWNWPGVAKKIEQAEGEWVFVNPDGPMLVSTVYALKRGNMVAINPDLYEFTTRNNTTPPNRTCDLYMRLKQKENSA